MLRRGIAREILHQVVTAPEQRIDLRLGRVILQSRLKQRAGEATCLVRIVVDIDRRPPEVVTAYRTSRIAKYWRATE